MKPDTRVSLREGLTAADLGDEAVVLDTNEGTYFGLNEVGARIFQLVREPRRVSEVINALKGEFDVGEERLRNDVVTFLEQLRDRGLVVVADE